jgi:thiol:disulfide interchange protein DsbD
MEENVWVQDEVRQLIQKDFILVSLYVDDRRVLPANAQMIYTTRDSSQKSIRTIGDKYATFQSENFRNASQPLYVILSPNEKLLTLPVGYTPSAKEYAAWLSCGVKAMR